MKTILLIVVVILLVLMLKEVKDIAFSVRTIEHNTPTLKR